MQKHVWEYIEEHGLDPAMAKDKTITRQVVAERTIKVLTDAFVVFRKLGHDPDATLDNIGRQLQTMNKALAAMPHIETYMKQMYRKMSSVPAMAAHMDLMNWNIASMTTSMGSTMGRMGEWMPW